MLKSIKRHILRNSNMLRINRVQINYFLKTRQIISKIKSIQLPGPKGTSTQTGPNVNDASVQTTANDSTTVNAESNSDIIRVI